MRKGMPWFTRLTQAFSSKLESRSHSVSFYFMVCNFVKIHKITKPEMEVGVTTYLLSMEDIVLMAKKMA